MATSFGMDDFMHLIFGLWIQLPAPFQLFVRDGETDQRPEHPGGFPRLYGGEHDRDLHLH